MVKWIAFGKELQKTSRDVFSVEKALNSKRYRMLVKSKCHDDAQARSQDPHSIPFQRGGGESEGRKVHRLSPSF